MDEAARPGRRRVFRQNPNVVSSRVGQAGVLVHLQSNRIFELNATGVRIWELLAEERELSEIESALQSEFNADTARLQADVSSLTDALLREGLIDSRNE